MANESKHNGWFKITISILIALVALASAVAAGRAAFFADDASDADLVGLAAVLNAEGTRTLNSVNLQQHYSAYTDYVRYQEQGNLLHINLEDQSYSSEDSGADPLVQELRNRREDAYDRASVSQFFFVPRYLQEDGGYDSQRELDEAWAEAVRWQDLDPEPHFAQADQLREKATRLVGTLVVFAVSLWFYILASGTQHPTKYALALVGFFCTVAGVVMGLRVEALF